MSEQTFLFFLVFFFRTKGKITVIRNRSAKNLHTCRTSKDDTISIVSTNFGLNPYNIFEVVLIVHAQNSIC